MTQNYDSELILFVVAELENVSIKRPFYASNMYRQFIPAEPPKRKQQGTEEPGGTKHKNPRPPANTSTLTQLPVEMLQIITTFLGGDLLRSLQESRNMMMTCKALAEQKDLWTAPATWTDLPKVVENSPKYWKDWINTSQVTALTLRRCQRRLDEERLYHGRDQVSVAQVADTPEFGSYDVDSSG